MEGIELAAFNIITAVGEAKSKLHDAVDESMKGNKEKVDELIKEANIAITKGDKEHFKLISEDSKNKDINFSLLLVHAEDQLMSAEIFRDFTIQLVNTNLELFKLREVVNNKS
jgi:PTS system cellobiose-specific IIA component